MEANLFRLLAAACAVGVLTGILLADGTSINFRGDDLRRAIERLDDEPDNP